MDSFETVSTTDKDEMDSFITLSTTEKNDEMDSFETLSTTERKEMDSFIKKEEIGESGQSTMTSLPRSGQSTMTEERGGDEMLGILSEIQQSLSEMRGVGENLERRMDGVENQVRSLTDLATKQGQLLENLASVKKEVELSTQQLLSRVERSEREVEGILSKNHEEMKFESSRTMNQLNKISPALDNFREEVRGWIGELRDSTTEQEKKVLDAIQTSREEGTLAVRDLQDDVRGVTSHRAVAVGVVTVMLLLLSILLNGAQVWRVSQPPPSSSDACGVDGSISSQLLTPVTSSVTELQQFVSRQVELLAEKIDAWPDLLSSVVEESFGRRKVSGGDGPPSIFNPLQ